MKPFIYGLNKAPEPVGLGTYSVDLPGSLATEGHQVRMCVTASHSPVTGEGMTL